MQTKLTHQVEQYIDKYATDETQAKAMRLAVIGTGILWFILLILLAISPGFHKQKKYKTVHITLAPVVEQPVQDKKVASSAAASAPAPSAAEKKTETAPKKQEAAAPKAPAKPVTKTVPAQKPAAKPAAKPVETPKAASTSAPKAAIKYKKSVDELMAEQSSTSTKKNVDWDSMDFSESSSSSSSTSSTSAAKSIDSSSALSGSAATATSANSTVSSQTAKASAGTTASSSTASALSNISSTSYSMSAANGLKSTASVGVSTSSDGKLALAMTDGSARVLLDPSKPYITISDENAKLIDSTRNVVISFTILPAGSVPLSGIRISPSSALPMAVQSEIKEQIAKWRFAQASTDGQARFDYSIIKR